MIYIVSGLYRSGTSMMMQAMEAGGLSIVKNESRDKFSQNHSDQYYKPNPLSLYEPSIRELHQIGFPKQHEGKAVKVVAPWLHWLSAHEYKCVFMRRDLEEIRQSFEAAFDQNIPIERLQQTLDEALALCMVRSDIEIKELWYDQVLSDPNCLADLGWPIDIKKASTVIDPKQKRYHKEKLVVGL